MQQLQIQNYCAMAFQYTRLARGVLATIASFVVYALHRTVMKALGVLLVAIRDDFETDTWVAGTVFSATDCVTDLMCPIVGPIGKRFGYRRVCMFGGVMTAAAIIVVSQAPSFLLVAIPLIGPVALGRSITVIITCAALGERFDDREFALASGIAKMGSALAYIGIPQLVQLCLGTYGWRGTLLILGALCAHLIVCGALIVSSETGRAGANLKNGYQSLPNGDRCPDTERKQQELSPHRLLLPLKSFYRRMEPIFCLSVLLDFNFWAVTLINIINKIALMAWVIYFVPNAEDRGFSGEIASFMVTVAGVGHIIGILVGSLVVFKQILSSMGCLMLSIPFIAVPLCIGAWMTTSWLMTANATVLMLALGCSYTLVTVVLKEVISNEKFPYAVGWTTFFTSASKLMGGFIPGWLFDHRGSFEVGFAIIGAMQFISFIPIIAQRLLCSKTNCQ
ncbi:monocarboxylate transporter 12-like [Acanthaster planci]|uniref:Monocarboxylate transporter 12-like n=1 Tax=Acanthaster planci TaxID=133434 RepID=A0A8B7Y7N4_ACAPL|nr:monocarboxylate transporter 12-like [Acanthaster planci]